MNEDVFAALCANLQCAPDDQLDPQMVEKVKAWSVPAKALEILEVLDLSIYGAAASGLVISALQALLEFALQRDGQTLNSIIPQATWRAQ